MLSHIIYEGSKLIFVCVLTFFDEGFGTTQNCLIQLIQHIQGSEEKRS